MKTLSVETPYGFTATRKTARTYTHVVVVSGQSLAYREKLKAIGVNTVKGYVTRYEKFAENARRNGGSWTETYNGGFGRKVWTVAEAEQAAARAAKQLAEDEAKPVSESPEPSVFAWCGRYDLAVKQAAEAAKFGYEGILILPVE